MLKRPKSNIGPTALVEQPAYCYHNDIEAKLMKLKHILINAIFAFCILCPAAFAQQDTTVLNTAAQAHLPVDLRERYKALSDTLMSYEGLDTQSVQADWDRFFLKIQSAIHKGNFYRHLKTAPLNKDFQTVCLVSIEDINKKGATIKTDNTRPQREFKVEEALAGDLAQMFRDAQKAGLKLKICSTYRSYEYQLMLVREFVAAGLGAYVAMPGKSEHCLGLACDFEGPTKPYINTKEARWTMQYSERYGFAMTMPQGSVPFEPWHYRYVGHEGIAIKNEYFKGNVISMLRFFTLYRGDIIELIHTKKLIEEERLLVEAKNNITKYFNEAARKSKEKMISEGLKAIKLQFPNEMAPNKQKKGRIKVKH